MPSKLIFLAWNHAHNKSRIHSLADQFRKEFSNIYVQDYQHRWSEYPNMDLEEELEILINETQSDKEPIIIAKSMWAILALMLMIEKDIHPKKCIFMGFPMWFVDRSEFPFEEYLSQVETPILFIQKTEDPTWSFQTIKKSLIWFSDKFSFKEITWSNHEYDDLTELKKIILEYLG